MRTDPKGEKGRFAPRAPARWPEDPSAPEQVIKNGGGSCEWVARLHLSLLQAADIPARLVMRRVHSQVEVFLDGKWMLHCPLMGDHGEKFLAQPPGRLRGKSAYQAHDSKDPKQEVAIGWHYLGEQTRQQWLTCKPAPGKDPPPSPLPEQKPNLEYSFNDGMLHLKPVAQPGPPEPLYMVAPRWVVHQGKARAEFATGLFFHLNQAVAGEENWKNVALAARVQRDPKSGRAAGLAGLVFRASGQNYNAVVLADERSVLVLRIEDGWKTRVLAVFPVPLSRDSTVTLHVRCLGDTAHVWLERSYLGSVSTGLWPAGRVGLAAVQTAVFDDFKVWLNPLKPSVPDAPTQEVQSEDCHVPEVLSWDRLLLEVPMPASQCQPEYSTDQGKTWKKVSRDHGLGEVSPESGRIRFRFRTLPRLGPVRVGVEYRISGALKPKP
jgi:hypothetical protein